MRVIESRQALFAAGVRVLPDMPMSSTSGHTRKMFRRRQRNLALGCADRDRARIDNQQRCRHRDVSRLAREFERLPMRVQQPVGMFMDQATYRLWSRTASQEVSAIIGSASSGESSDALVKWIHALSRAVGISDKQ